MKNPILNICVGVWVGGHPAKLDKKWISSESALNQFHFLDKKIAHRKKLTIFFPEFNLGITEMYYYFHTEIFLFRLPMVLILL